MYKLTMSNAVDKLKASLAAIFNSGDYTKLLKGIQKNIHPSNRSKVIAVAELDDLMFLLKVYAPNGIIWSIDREDGLPAPTAETIIIQRLLEAVGDRTPCIPMLFGSYEMSEADFKKHYRPMVHCMTQGGELCKIWESIDIGESVGRPVFIAMELCKLNFSEFCSGLRTHYDVWILKSMVWMLLYTFYVIRKAFPKFAHSDIWGRNLMIHIDTEFAVEDRSRQQYYLQFESDLGVFQVPYYGLIPKIIDYEMTVLDDQISSVLRAIVEEDDVVKLLLFIYSIQPPPNQLTEMVDKLIGFAIPPGSAAQQSAYIKSKGGLPPLEKMLSSPVFGYDKKMGGEMWGSW